MQLSIFFQHFLLNYFNAYQMEKCSESTGINSVLYFCNSLFIIFQAQIIVSLFAIAIFLVNFIILKVGTNPSIPTIELIT